MLSEGNDTQLPENELIQRYRDTGDLGVLGDLYSRYMSMVYGVCLKYLKGREESQDAVMQIFERLVTLLKDHTVVHFKSWLYVTSRNHCLMQLRAEKGKYFEGISDEFMEKEALLHPEEEPDLESNLGKLEECIAKLTEEQKHCVTLFYLQQKCYKEIVQMTGFEDKKVKSYIQNGKRNLKICMEQNA